MASSTPARMETADGDASVENWMLSRDPLIVDWKKTPFRALQEVIRAGELKMLQKMAIPKELLRATFNINGNPWFATHVAAKYGQLEILQWLVLEHDVPLVSKRLGVYVAGSPGSPHSLAASHGHLDCLRWLTSQRPSLLNASLYWELFLKAILKGHIEIVVWFFDTFYPEQAFSEQELVDVRGSAIASGKESVIKLLEDRGLLKLEKYLKARKVPLWLSYLYPCAKANDTAPLDYALSRKWVPHHGSATKETIGKLMQSAISADAFEFVRWFVDHGIYPQSSKLRGELFKASIITCRLELVQYLLQQLGKPLEIVKDLDMSYSAYNPDPGVSRWLVANGCTYDPNIEQQMLLHAAHCGNLGIIKWISLGTNISDPALQQQMLVRAVKCRAYPVVRFLVEELHFPMTVRFDRSLMSLLHCAVICGDLDLAMWLVDNKRIDVNDTTGGETPATLNGRNGNDALYFVQASGGRLTDDYPSHLPLIP